MLDEPKKQPKTIRILLECISAVRDNRAVNDWWNKDQPYSRPGISLATLKNEGITHVPAEVAELATGMRASGLLIPFRNSYNLKAFEYEESKPFYRLRFDVPRGKQKYHQPVGTNPEIYMPRTGRNSFFKNDFLVIVEGEFKALSLMERGIPAVGISGFYGYDRHGKLHGDLDLHIETEKVSTVYFLGDTDTAHNFQFSDAAIKLRQLLPSEVELKLPRIPYDQPKGIDDCIEDKGKRFNHFWDQLLADAVRVEPNISREELAMRLLEREFDKFPTDGEASRILVRKVAKLAGSLDAVTASDISKIVCKRFDISKTDFKSLVTAAKQAAKREKDRVDPVTPEELGRVVPIDEPEGIWPVKVLCLLKDLVYAHGGTLSTIGDGCLVPMDAEMLTVYMARPDRVQFVRKSNDGFERAKIDPRDTKLVMGAARLFENREHLREVNAVVSIPTLMNVGSGRAIETRLVEKKELCNGTLVLPASTSHPMPPISDIKMNTTKAVSLLLSILRDFGFATEADRFRAMSLIITPALCAGGFLGKERAPFFLITKPEPGVGGGTFCQLVSTIYGIRAKAHSQHDAKALGESLAEWLFSGEPFSYIDNLAGNVLVKNAEFCSLLTEPNYSARTLFKRKEVDVSRKIIAATSNGAELGPDLASRTVEIALKHGPREKTEWAGYGQGGGALLDFVEAKRNYYLAAIYHLIRVWAGEVNVRPETTGFRFRRWEEVSAGILEAAFCEEPVEHLGQFKGGLLTGIVERSLIPESLVLLEGMDARHQELAKPDAAYIRRLLQATLDSEIHREQSNFASDLARLILSDQLRDIFDESEMNSMVMEEAKKIGRLFGTAFPSEGTHPFSQGRFVVKVSRKRTRSDSYSRAYHVYRGDQVSAA